MLVGRKPPGSAGHHQSLPKHPQGEQRRTNRQNKETAGYSCNQTILLEGPRERTDLRACWAGGRGTEAKTRGARRQTYHRRGVPDPNRDPLSPFRKGRRGALQGCRQGTDSSPRSRKEDTVNRMVGFRRGRDGAGPPSQRGMGPSKGLAASGG